MDRPDQPSRRAFVKRAAHVAPAVLTLAAAPDYAKAGSAKPGRWSGGESGWGEGGSKGHAWGWGHTNTSVASEADRRAAGRVRRRGDAKRAGT